MKSFTDLTVSPLDKVEGNPLRERMSNSIAGHWSLTGYRYLAGQAKHVARWVSKNGSAG